MKKILFDLYSSQPTQSSKFHGGGEYIKTVFNQLVKSYGQAISLSVFYDPDRYLDQWILDLLETHSIDVYPIYALNEVQNIFEKIDIDVFYTGLPYNYEETWIPNNVLVHSTVHGLRGLEKAHDQYELKYDEKPSLRNRLRLRRWNLLRNTEGYRNEKRRYWSKLFKNTDEVICDSEHSKFAIIANYPSINPEHIHVFFAPSKRLPDDIESDTQLPDKYILLLGGDRWIKNVYRGLVAINELMKLGHLSQYEVVIVGKLPTRTINEFEFKTNFHFFDYVSSEDLETMYKKCDFFLYPTLNEGFGYPPLEAMKYGKTVIASGVCSIPEICKDAVYYVNPYDILEIENRIMQASTVKISQSKVLARSEVISKRQQSDLNALCDFIVQGGIAND